MVLEKASAFVKPGGRLAYVTCSVLREENAARVEAFLKSHPTFRLQDAEAVWAEKLPGAPKAYHSERLADGAVLTLTPLRSGTDGFFFALLERAA